MFCLGLVKHKEGIDENMRNFFGDGFVHIFCFQLVRVKTCITYDIYQCTVTSMGLVLYRWDIADFYVTVQKNW